MSTYKNLGNEVGALVDKKNAAYGNSFGDAGKFLQILYPNNIPISQYSDVLFIIRMFDKLKRVVTNKSAFGEDPKNDMLGLLVRWIKDDDAITHEDKEIQDVKEIVKSKKEKYGDSVDKAVTKMLQTLFPEKIVNKKYDEVLFLIRICEKLGRISSENIDDEALIDAYRDTVGYGLLGYNTIRAKLKD